MSAQVGTKKVITKPPRLLTQDPVPREIPSSLVDFYIVELRRAPLQEPGSNSQHHVARGRVGIALGVELKSGRPPTILLSPPRASAWSLQEDCETLLSKAKYATHSAVVPTFLESVRIGRRHNN